VLAALSSGELSRTYGIWRWTGRLELAPSLTDLIDTRIDQLTPDVRTVVELVAFGEPLGLELLNRAADPTDVETAEERGLIAVVRHDRQVNVRLAHPLYGEVMRRQCPVSRTDDYERASPTCWTGRQTTPRRPAAGRGQRLTPVRPDPALRSRRGAGVRPVRVPWRPGWPARLDAEGASTPPSCSPSS
jgi:hypothetical protein